jgi:hypothetical protein
MVFEACQNLLETGNVTNVTEVLEVCPLASSVIGGMVGGALITLGIFLGLLVLAALYVYTSIAWYSIAKKMKYRYPWIAWIPIVRVAMVLSMGGFHWAWIFLLLVPALGWAALLVLGVIAMWRIFKKTKHPGWFSLAILIPEIGGILYLIAIGIVAWDKKK